MKIFSTLSLIFFLFYMFEIYQEYTVVKTDKKEQISQIDTKPVDVSLDLLPHSYLFTDEAWKIKRKKVVKVEKDDSNDSILTPLKIDSISRPITICEKERCFEFIGLENGKAIFYGLNDSNTSTFIRVGINESLDKRILLTKASSRTIELLDRDLNQTHSVKMFDINITKYKTKDKKNED